MTPPLTTVCDTHDPTTSHAAWPPESPVERLGEQIAALAARLHAATYELLVMLREFDEQIGWNNGFLSCAHWLHWRTSIDLGAAREKVRVARALARLPRVSGAMQRGEISYAKVRALTRIATPGNEAQLLDLAYTGTAAHVERIARAWRRCDRTKEVRDRERCHLSRTVTTWIDDDGMLVLRARLTPELGAIVQRAIDAASDRLYQESKGAAPPESVAEEVTAAQRRADALGLLAECALHASLDGGSAADRYQVVVHLDAADATDSLSQAVLEMGDGGVHVSAETSRRVACDASTVVMREGPDGAVLDVGRKTRTVPAAIRRALAVRDGRCQFPGCAARHCDAHHITHWADGGHTSLDNLLLLCRRHHRLVHEGGISVSREGHDVAFVRPDGRQLPSSPPMASDGTLEFDRSIGAHSLPCWDGTPFRLAYIIDVLRGHEPLSADAGQPRA